MDVRKVYRELTADEAKAVVELKARGEHLLVHIEDCAQLVAGRAGRELALARTKVEEAVMWAVKGITG